MHIGEIRVDQGNFQMMTPTGIQRITLRCRTDGAVMVEEVCKSGLSISPVHISQLNAEQRSLSYWVDMVSKAENIKKCAS